MTTAASEEKQTKFQCRIHFVSGDLFTSPADMALAHCVSTDFKMSKGIAVQFRDRYKHVDYLLSLNKKVGQMACLYAESLANDEKESTSKFLHRYVYYLVTKKFYYGKPTYVTLRQSLENMKEHMNLHGVTKLAMPRIGCGLDGLEWERVQVMLQEVFADESIDLYVYTM